MATSGPTSRPTNGPDVVATLRRFNRSHTQRIGALDESFLDTGRPLGQSRLLFEIGPDGAGVLDLRQRLGLDSGYLSRLLRQLESDDLVEVTPDADDARRRTARLTAAGRRAWRDLDRRSHELATAITEPLSASRRAELAAVLDRADRLLRSTTVSFDVVDPRSDAALTSMGRYFAELDVRFTDGFDPGDTLVADAPGFAAPDGRFVVARSDGEPIACGGIQRVDDSTAEIKRMWVSDEWRGLGLGRRMLANLEGHIADMGHRRVILDTNATLLEAIAMYERAGYTAIERYNDNPYAQRWFEKPLDVAR